MPSITGDNRRFDLQAGRLIGGKYEVVSHIGHGWEGEVYRVVERATGAIRAAKLFLPERNPHDRAVLFYARKLERLRDCRMVIQYHHVERMRIRNEEVTALVSEYVEGTRLDRLVTAVRGRRLPEFEALSIVHELTCGLEELHAQGEYHGDLHAANILVRRRGVRFDIKLVDFFDRGRGGASHRRDDLVQVARILRELVGGTSRYAGCSPAVRRIICAGRSDLVMRRFPTAAHLRRHLEIFDWEAA